VADFEVMAGFAISRSHGAHHFRWGWCQNARMRFFKDLSPAAVAAGFVAVLVGFTSSVALVFQAAQAFHATPGKSLPGFGRWAWAWVCVRWSLR
jgi:benzoate membrane transport protein